MIALRPRRCPAALILLVLGRRCNAGGCHNATTRVRSLGRVVAPPARCEVATGDTDGVDAPALREAGVINCATASSNGQRRLGAGQPFRGSDGAWRLNSGDSCYKLDLGLATSIAQLVGRGSTLTELGAGLGCYTAWLSNLHVTIIAAVDGLVDATTLTGGRVTQWNLACSMEARADWVLSLEVAEHIPKRIESAFVKNLVGNARCGIVLSWAPPGQNGKGHVNLKTQQEVSYLLSRHSFIHNVSASQRLKQSATLYWLQNNIEVYSHHDPQGRPMC